MRKRPLCFVTMGLIIVQILLTGGHFIGYDRAFSFLAEDESYVAEVVGTVYKREEKSKCQILYLKKSRIHINKKSIDNSNILVRVETKNHILIGNKIKVIGKATGFQSARNAGNFDLKKYYASRKIYMQIQADNVKILDYKVSCLKEKLAVLRKKWKNLLLEQMGEQYGNIVSAMLIGDKSELDAKTARMYKQTGIGHVLAISGLHMSFIGVGIYSILRKSGLSFVGSGIISFVFLTTYTVLTGCGVSSLRALIMFLIRMGAEITGKDYDMVTSMAVTACVMCLVRPLYLMDAGFILSNTALIGIAVVMPCIQECFPSKNKFAKALLSGIGIQITLLPVILYYYFEIPLFSIAINILVVPLMSAVLGTGIFGSLFGIFWGQGAKILFSICKFILWFYGVLCNISLKIPKSIWITGRPMFAGILIYYGSLFCFCYIVVCARSWKIKLRKKRIAGLSGVILFSTLWLSCYIPQINKNELVVTMLDVGQGDGLHIKTPTGQHLFIDGGSSNIAHIGEQRIGPFLKCNGVKKLEYVMISHSDADHKNGIEELLKDQKNGIKIGTLLLPEKKVWDEGIEELAQLANKTGTNVKIFGAGQTMTDGKIRMKCLAPGKEYQSGSGNQASMVLELKYKKFSMLFTGDIEGEGERQLENSGKLRKYYVLKVAHHGSKNSTSEKFLEKTKPEIAWISSGINNRYGHPGKETLKRLKKYGCQIYRTQKNGAVTLKTDGHKIELYSVIK